MKEFIKKLYSFDQGKITLCNLIDCINLEILSSGNVCGLLSDTFEKYKLLDPEDQTDISWDDLSSLLGSVMPPTEIKGRKIYSRSHAINESLKNTLRLVHVTKIEYFNNLIDETSVPEHFKTTSSANAFEIQSYLEDLQRIKNIPCKEGALLGNPNSGLVFLGDRQRKDEVLEPITNVIEKGERIRDFLALPHNPIDSAIGLIGFEIPPQITNRSKFPPVRPSAFDAGFFELFKTRSVADNHSPAQVGYTCDLYKLYNAEKDIDGGLELITECLPLKGNDELTITCIGVVESKILENTTECLAANLIEGRNTEDEINALF